MAAPDERLDSSAATGSMKPPEDLQANDALAGRLGEMDTMESMCPRCQGNGITRMLITKVPHFRELIVSSFECGNPSCGERNNEVEFGGVFGEKHVRYELAVTTKEDLNRQVVKSEWASVSIPELELEIPSGTQRGVLNTVEGLLARTAEGLQALQAERRQEEPELAAKIDAFCAKIELYREGTTPFTVLLDDPAGNSYIEAYYTYYHPTMDPKLKRMETTRTDIERQLLGLALEYNQHTRTDAEEAAVGEGIEGEVFEMAQHCPACNAPGVVRMHKCDIPYFMETVIMAFKCEVCGYKNAEVKNGGAIPSQGCRLTLAVLHPEDLKRDVLKSDSARLEIPELDLELEPGTLGGFFSSVEGVLLQIEENLARVGHAEFDSGDAAPFDLRRKSNQITSMKEFITRIAHLREGNTPFTLILDDPMAGVYIQNPRAHLPPPENEDPQLKKELYDRTWDQDEELGIHDMKVD